MREGPTKPPLGHKQIVGKHTN